MHDSQRICDFKFLYLIVMLNYANFNSHPVVNFT